MYNLLYEALDMVDIGIIIIDENFTVLVWNHLMEKLSRLTKIHAVNKKLYEVCPVFLHKKYENILNDALFHGKSRFCSSVLHKAFIYPADIKDNIDLIRQNMKIKPIYLDNKRYAFIEITDITNYFDNEIKMKTVIKDLESAYENIKTTQETTKQLAYQDSLTGLLNRVSFSNELSNALKSSTLNNTSLAVLFLDLDEFKNVNDTFGHDSGDVVLKTVAQRLKNNLRSSDIIGRRGGDEFTILLNNICSENNISPIAQKLVNEIKRPYILDNGEANISVSIGISIYPKDGHTAEELIRKADKAMYFIKKTCKNSYYFYRNDLY